MGHTSMTIMNAGGHDAIKRKSDMADVIVKGAIAIVTVAIFLGAYLQFDVSILQSLAAAVGVFVASMALNTLVRRSERVEVLANEVIRLESEVANLTGRRPGPGPLPEPSLQAPAKTHAPSPPGLAPVSRTSGDTFGAPIDLVEPPRQREAAAAVPLAIPGDGLAPPSAGAALPQVPETQQTQESTRWPVSAPAPKPKNDYWAFRPANGPQSERPAPRGETPEPSHESETDLEAVQGMLKKLAKEADVAEAAPSSAPPSEQHNESALKASVDALHSAAQDMRAAASKAPASRGASTQEAKGPLPPPIVPVHARLSALGEAISANRVDVYMDPILGLADAKVHHHELVVSLRDPRGATLPGSPHDPALSKTGLMPLLDSTRVRRAAEVATSLSKRGHKGSVFVTTTAESLDSNQFLNAFADAYRDRQELVDQLVLFFSQSEVLAFSDPQWGALTDMHELGFRFGLEGVSDLNFDFAALGAAGFAFLKLNADVFRKGLPATRGPVSANDICRYLKELGVTVIVGGIDHEAKRSTALNFGAQLGQGPLFGAPQATAPQRLKGARIAAA